MSTQTILINISGQDQAGLMSLLSGVLTEFDTRLLDIGQAVIHSDLALGVLVRVAVAQQADFVQAVQKTLADAGALHRITAVSRDEYLRWLAASGQPRFILTLLALGDGVAPLHSVSTQLFKYGLNN